MHSLKNKKFTLIPGRFEPFHFGHLQMAVDSEYHPLFVMITPERKQGYFSAELRYNIISAIWPTCLLVASAKNGYVPDIITDLEQNFELQIKQVIAGPDRIDDYKRQVKNYNEKHEPLRRIRFTKSKRIGSGTAVRSALRSGDLDLVRELLPPPAHKYILQLAEQLRKHDENI